jgi:hypothetical protein
MNAIRRLARVGRKWIFLLFDEAGFSIMVTGFVFFHLLKALVFEPLFGDSVGLTTFLVLLYIVGAVTTRSYFYLVRND